MFQLRFFFLFIDLFKNLPRLVLLFFIVSIILSLIQPDFANCMECTYVKDWKGTVQYDRITGEVLQECRKSEFAYAMDKLTDLTKDIMSIEPKSNSNSLPSCYNCASNTVSNTSSSINSSMSSFKK